MASTDIQQNQTTPRKGSNLGQIGGKTKLPADVHSLDFALTSGPDCDLTLVEVSVRHGLAAEAMFTAGTPGMFCLSADVDCAKVCVSTLRQTVLCAGNALVGLTCTCKLHSASGKLIQARSFDFYLEKNNG